VNRVLFAHRVLPPLPLDVTHDPVPYAAWVQRREEQRLLEFVVRADAASLHLVMAIDGEPPPETVRSLHALQQQTSSEWTLTVVVENSWQTAFTALLSVSGLQRTSQRVRVEVVPDASPAAHMLQVGLSTNSGSNVSFLFPGDVWAPDTVAQLANALSSSSVVYADEDTITPQGEHVDPRLKPAYSPEFLLSSSYTGRPLAIGAGIAPRLGTFTGSFPELEHDLTLRSCELAETVLHLPEVLCHRLLPDPDAPTGTGHDVGHVTAALERRGEAAVVLPGPDRGTYRVRRHSSGAPSTTIIIPFRDEPRLMRACIESVDATRGVGQVDFVLVDNGSVQPETQTLIERLAQRDDVVVLPDARPFNWSELNNAAAELATGDVFLFLNNDIEANEVGWIDLLAAQAMRPEVGAVGARLLYPNQRVQHCGVVIGMGGAADHVLAGLEEHEPGYLHMATSTREVASVTGACLATRRQVFESLGGFDDALGVDLNDIDYCLRAQRSGLQVLYEANVELIHHESPSRGFAGSSRDIIKFIERWKTSILSGDPYLNPHLTRMDRSCALRGPNEEAWWYGWYEEFTKH
jgi:O-antigen biosynthesis protein